MFYKIYYIHINNVSDLNKLLSKLHNIGYQESYLSEFSFCPYIIIHKDFEKNKIPIYENINKGYLDMLKTKVILKEDTDIDSFISHAYEIVDDNVNSNSLFECNYFILNYIVIIIFITIEFKIIQIIIN